MEFSQGRLLGQVPGRIIILFIVLHLLSFTSQLTIEDEPSATQAISHLTSKYTASIGHDILNPPIKKLSVSPEEASHCEVSKVKQCYIPLPHLHSGGSQDVCSICKRVCQSYNLADLEKYDWIDTNTTRNNTRYSAISEYVSKVVLPDGRYGLSSDYSALEQVNRRRQWKYYWEYDMAYEWADGTNAVTDPETNTLSGTISYRLHLNSSNLYQWRDQVTGEADGKCRPIELLYLSGNKLKIACNEGKDNMDLFLESPVDGKLQNFTVEPSVLNDDAPTASNSIHIAAVFDRTHSVKVLYVNGIIVHSALSDTSGDFFSMFGDLGYTGLWYDFYFYKDPLSPRLINEIYRNRTVPVEPANECYCPPSHPVFIHSSGNVTEETWKGKNCGEVGNTSYLMDSAQRADAMRQSVIERISGHTNSYTNLNGTASEEYWISGDPKDFSQASIKLSLTRFYHIIAFSVYVETLPESLTVRTQNSIILIYNMTCEAVVDIHCKTWDTVTIIQDLLLIDLAESVSQTGGSRDVLRSDRLELLLEGNYDHETVQPYVMRGVQLYADCGCIDDRGTCYVTDVSRGEFSCKCDEQYEGEYCERCSPTYKRNPNGGDCIACDCNRDGAFDQLCSIEGNCRCKAGAGPQCNPYIDSLEPTHGPMAGGTKLKLTGVLLHQVTNVTIQGLECEIIHESRGNSSIECLTPSLQREVAVNIPTPVAITINGLAEPTSYNTGQTFEYHKNPNITSLDRTSTIIGGGLSIKFKGTNLQGVESPSLLVHVMCRGSETLHATYMQSCKYIAITSVYICDMPSLHELSNYTSVCDNSITRKRRQAEETEQTYSVWMGLQLDGFTLFNNLSEVGWLDVPDVIFHPDPVLLPFKTLNKDGVHVIKSHSSAQEGPLLYIRGRYLNLATSMEDYQVKAGKSYVAIINLNSTHITCQLNSRAPGHNDEPDVPIFQEQPSSIINVTVAGNTVTVGYIGYDIVMDIKPEVIIGVVVVIVIIIAAIIAGAILYRRHKIKMRKDRERNMMRGFELVPEPSSLQTQVQSLLIEEELNGHLFDHLIPAAFVTQEAIIGQGHFGQVYRGKVFVPEINIDKIIAIKALKSQGLTARAVVNFVKEALIMKDFQHMNVLPLVGIVYEHAEADALPLVVTPYMEKGDLKTLISDSSYEFTAGDLLHFGLQIAAGMSYLSGRKFIHRDLRAANCMVDSMFIVKVGDFGLSHDLADSDYYVPQDKSKPLPVKWMAIEVLSEQSKYTTKSDVWSYGVLLWELMTRGYQPYADVQNSQIKNYIMNGHRLSKPDHVPDKIYDIMAACWAVDPVSRPSFEDLTKTVSALLKQADGSAQSSYHTDYTTPLREVDYVNPEAAENSEFDAEWTALIPLIKAHSDYYADNGRIADEENADSESDLDPSSVRMRRPHGLRSDEGREASLRKELVRMSTDPTHGNDYHGLNDDPDNDMEVKHGLTVNLESIHGEVSGDNSDSDESPPPIPERRPSALPDTIAKDIAVGSMYANRFEESNPGAKLQVPSEGGRSLKTKVPIESQLSSGSGNSTGVYEEACEVMNKINSPRKFLTQTSVTTVAADGYLEFGDVTEQHDLSQTQNGDLNNLYKSDAPNGHTQCEKIEEAPSDNASGRVETSVDPKSPASTTAKKKWQQLLKRMSSASLINSDPSSDGGSYPAKPLMKSLSTSSPGQSFDEPVTPSSKIRLSTVVPVKNKSRSFDRMNSTEQYEEACSVWRSSKPGTPSLVTTPTFEAPPEVAQRPTSSVTTNQASDGYLEFETISEDEGSWGTSVLADVFSKVNPSLTRVISDSLCSFEHSATRDRLDEKSKAAGYIELKDDKEKTGKSNGLMAPVDATNQIIPLSPRSKLDDRSRQAGYIDFDEVSDEVTDSDHKPGKPSLKDKRDAFVGQNFVAPKPRERQNEPLCEPGYVDFGEIYDDYEDDLRMPSMEAPQPEQSAHSSAKKKDSSRPRKISRQHSIEFFIEEPDVLGKKSPEIGTRKKQRLPTPASSFDQPKPVARISPMARDDWEMIIPPPLENGSSNLKGAYYNPVVDVSDEAPPTATPYQNISELDNPSGPVSPTSSHTPTRHGAVKKKPIPIARVTQQGRPENIHQVSPESAREDNTSASLAINKPIMAPSPNTRRRNVQESLNAQVAGCAGNDSPVVIVPVGEYYNLQSDTSDYENAVPYDQASPEYENTQALLSSLLPQPLYHNFTFNDEK